MATTLLQWKRISSDLDRREPSNEGLNKGTCTWWQGIFLSTETFLTKPLLYGPKGTNYPTHKTDTASFIDMRMTFPRNEKREDGCHFLGSGNDNDYTRGFSPFVGSSRRSSKLMLPPLFFFSFILFFPFSWSGSIQFLPPNPHRSPPLHLYPIPTTTPAPDLYRHSPNPSTAMPYRHGNERKT